MRKVLWTSRTSIRTGARASCASRPALGATGSSPVADPRRPAPSSEYSCPAPGAHRRHTLPSAMPLTQMSTYLEPGWIDRFAELWESLGPETRTSILGLLPEGWTFTG